MHTLNGQIFGVAMCASGVSNKDSGVVAIRAVERAYESIRRERAYELPTTRPDLT